MDGQQNVTHFRFNFFPPDNRTFIR